VKPAERLAPVGVVVQDDRHVLEVVARRILLSEWGEESGAAA
jgi:hypothetical protein